MTNVVSGLLIGLAFGFVIQRAGATSPHKMARSHLMIDSDIPRFMLATVVFAAIGLAGMKASGAAITQVLPTSIVATGLGGIIFGIGWGIAGYCPGTTWAAVGEGRMDAVFALLGGFFGASAFAHVHERLIPLLYAPTNLGQLTLGDWLLNDTVGLLTLAVVFSIAVYAIGRLWAQRT